MFMPRVAAPQEQGRLAAGGIRLLRGGVSQPAPGVVAVFGFQRTVTVGNMRDTAQVITTNVVKAERKVKLV